MGRLWGYTRISTVHQSAGLQQDALVDAGVDERDIFNDVVTGASAAADRPGWRRLMSRVQPGDTICVWRIDRLGRSVADVVSTVQELQDKGITVRSILDGIDPTNAAGRLMLSMMATLAEYERDLITERVKAGMEAAKARGVKFGRQPLDLASEMSKAKVVAKLVSDGKSATEAGKIVGWSRATTYRRLALLSDHTTVDRMAGTAAHKERSRQVV